VWGEKIEGVACILKVDCDTEEYKKSHEIEFFKGEKHLWSRTIKGRGGGERKGKTKAKIMILTNVIIQGLGMA